MEYHLYGPPGWIKMLQMSQEILLVAQLLANIGKIHA